MQSYRNVEIGGTCLFGPAAYYPAFRGLQHGIRRVTEGWMAGRIPLHIIFHVRLYNFALLLVPQPARRRGHSVVRMGVHDSAEDSWCPFARLNPVFFLGKDTKDSSSFSFEALLPTDRCSLPFTLFLIHIHHCKQAENRSKPPSSRPTAMSSHSKKVGKEAADMITTPSGVLLPVSDARKGCNLEVETEAADPLLVRCHATFLFLLSHVYLGSINHHLFR